MNEYRALQVIELAVDRDRATRQCGNCGKLYAVPDNVFNYECLCGSKTLYPTTCPVLG